MPLDLEHLRLQGRDEEGRKGVGRVRGVKLSGQMDREWVGIVWVYAFLFCIFFFISLYLFFLFLLDGQNKDWDETGLRSS
jgi:phage shock protein PspC (stress-responsive transcriptional regulator)